MWRLTIGRAAVTVALAVVAVIAAGDSRSSLGLPHRSDVMLIYVGAENCAPCRVWQSGDGVEFRRSRLFAELSYREVKAPNLLDVLKDDYWPEDLRSYREHVGRGAGVPLWLVISDREVVQQAFGVGEWRSIVQPRLRSLISP